VTVASKERKKRKKNQSLLILFQEKESRRSEGPKAAQIDAKGERKKRPRRKKKKGRNSTREKHWLLITFASKNKTDDLSQKKGKIPLLIQLGGTRCLKERRTLPRLVSKAGGGEEKVEDLNRRRGKKG